MSHPRNPGYIPGDHWVVCDICGFDYRASDMRTQWDGLVVCRKDYSARHPQDFVRAKKEKIVADYPIRPPQLTEENTLATVLDNQPPIAGVAIAGLAVVHPDRSALARDHTIPSPTFS